MVFKYKNQLNTGLISAKLTKSILTNYINQIVHFKIHQFT